jgi:acyl-ACP thioesterase
MMEFLADQSSTFDMMKVSLPETPPDAAERAFVVRRRDLDPLDHVNNSVYLDYFEEALETAGQGRLLATAPQYYEIDFVASAERDDRLVGRTWPLDDGWAYRLSRNDGTEIFRARFAQL